MLPENPSIVLVYPPALRKAEYHDTPPYPNISIAYIASAVRKAGFNNSKVIDAKLEKLSIYQTVEKILLHKPDLVGFSGLTNDFEQIKVIADQVKNAMSNTIIVCGGVHVSALPEESINYAQAIDYILINEAELTLPLLLKSLLSVVPQLDNIPNLCYRGDSEIITTDKVDWIEDLDSIDFPAWDMLQAAKEYPVITARGCPFGCRFCNPMGKKARERSAENVLKEVRYVIENFKPEFLWFFDETFGLNKSRATAILNGLLEIGQMEKIEWFASTRINTTTPEFMTQMYNAGCRKIGFGIEAGAERFLKEKNVDIQKAETLVKHGRDLGMKVYTYFILGHPDETAAEIMKTIKLAARINSTFPVFGIMVPYPGTEIYDMARKNQGGYRLTATSWNDYNKHIGNSVEFTKIGNLRLETLRIFAYLYFFISNLRFMDFFRFCIEFFGTALGVLKNILRRISN